MALFGEEEFLMQQCVTLSDLSFKNILLALLKENTLLGGDSWKKWTEAHTTCRGICSQEFAAGGMARSDLLFWVGERWGGLLPTER